MFTPKELHKACLPRPLYRKKRRKRPTDLKVGVPKDSRYKKKPSKRKPGIRTTDPTLRAYKALQRSNPQFRTQERADARSRYRKDPSKAYARQKRYYTKHRDAINAKRKANNWGRPVTVKSNKKIAS